MHLLNTIRRWLWRVKLNLIVRELDDVADDMADMKQAQNWGLYAALVEFRSDLMVEADQLRRKLAAHH